MSYATPNPGLLTMATATLGAFPNPDIADAKLCTLPVERTCPVPLAEASAEP